MTRDQWVGAFAAAAGVAPPSPADVDAILVLAAAAAHASERTAAPVACWLAAAAGLDPAEAVRRAEEIARPPAG